MTSTQLSWDAALYGGAWVAHGRAAVQWALSSEHLSSDRTAGWIRKAGAARGEQRGFRSLLSRAFIFLDGSEHLAARTAAASHFSVHQVLQRKALLHQWADEVAGAIPACSSVDLVEHYARQVPLRIMCHWMGIKVESSPGLWSASRALALFLERPSLHASVAREAEDAARWLIAALGLQEPLSDGQVQRLMLFFAGLETTRHLLSVSLLMGLQSTQTWQSLAQESCAQAVVHQVLREHPPIRITGRRVKHSHLAFGQALRRGDLVVADLHSAGLPFGSGPHTCLGAALTRTEAITALQALSQARPLLRLAKTPSPETWLAGPLYNGLTELWATDAPDDLPQSR